MQSDDEFLDSQSSQLDNAVKDGDLSRCQTLVQQLKSQSPSSARTTKQLGPALAAAVGCKHLHIVTYLLEHGAVISGNIMILALGETHEAIAMFQMFLDHGWDINSKTDLGNTMLKWANDPISSCWSYSLTNCRHTIRNEELIRWFLSHGADPNAYGKPGATILDVVAANSSPTVFDLLIAHGARLEDSDALHSAAGEREKRPGRVEMMTHLLEMGMDINAMGRRDYPPSRRIGRGTPLHAAVGARELDRIEFLLERGADMEVRNTLGQTPLEYAVAKGFATSEEFLRSKRSTVADIGLGASGPKGQGTP